MPKKYRRNKASYKPQDFYRVCNGDKVSDERWEQIFGKKQPDKNTNKDK